MEDPATWPTGRLLSTAARLVEHAWADHLESVGVTHAGLIALHVLQQGPCSQAELANACHVRAQTMSRILDRLEREGHVSRRPDPDDRRRIVVHGTATGAAALQAATGSGPEVLRLLDEGEEAAAFRDRLVEIVVQLASRRLSAGEASAREDG